MRIGDVQSVVRKQLSVCFGDFGQVFYITLSATRSEASLLHDTNYLLHTSGFGLSTTSRQITSPPDSRMQPAASTPRYPAPPVTEIRPGQHHLSSHKCVKMDSLITVRLSRRNRSAERMWPPPCRGFTSRNSGAAVLLILRLLVTEG